MRGGPATKHIDSARCSMLSLFLLRLASVSLHCGLVRSCCAKARMTDCTQHVSCSAGLTTPSTGPHQCLLQLCGWEYGEGCACLRVYIPRGWRHTWPGWGTPSGRRQSASAPARMVPWLCLHRAVMMHFRHRALRMHIRHRAMMMHFRYRAVRVKMSVQGVDVTSGDGLQQAVEPDAALTVSKIMGKAWC